MLIEWIQSITLKTNPWHQFSSLFSMLHVQSTPNVSSPTPSRNIWLCSETNLVSSTFETFSRGAFKVSAIQRPDIQSTFEISKPALALFSASATAQFRSFSKLLTATQPVNSTGWEKVCQSNRNKIQHVLMGNTTLQLIPKGNLIFAKVQLRLQELIRGNSPN